MVDAQHSSLRSLLRFLCPHHPTPSSASRRSASGRQRALELLLRKLASTGTFMQTDAHPDDEDNGLLAMLGHGQGMRTTLVTLTRGDGGQNEIGPETGQSLGVLRTEELLAVHRFDGAEQYFTRAIDFGFSFSVEESIEKWGHDEILGDLVRHIRTIRPDVIAGFLCGGAGRRPASPGLGAADERSLPRGGRSAQVPEQIKEGLRPWQARALLLHRRDVVRAAAAAANARSADADISGVRPGARAHLRGARARGAVDAQVPGHVAAAAAARAVTEPHLSAAGLALDRQRGVAPTMFEGIDVDALRARPVRGAAAAPALTAALAGRSQRRRDARAGARSRSGSPRPRRRAAGGRPDAPARALRGQSSRRAWSATRRRYEIDFRLAQKERAVPGRAAHRVAGAARGARGRRRRDAGSGASTCRSMRRTRRPAQLRGVTLRGFDGAARGVRRRSLAKAVTCKARVKMPATTHLSTPYWTPRKDAARYDFEPDVPVRRAVPSVAVPRDVRAHDWRRAVTVERTVEYRYSDLVAGEKRSELNVVARVQRHGRSGDRDRSRSAEFRQRRKLTEARHSIP